MPGEKRYPPYPLDDDVYWKGRHRCGGCDRERLARFGRDVYCQAYIVWCLEGQLLEDSEEGRKIRAELAREKQEEERRKAGLQ